MSALKDWYARILQQDSESNQLIHFVHSIQRNHDSKCKIVDVACGYGRTLTRLQKEGFDAIGVEINPDIVSKNKSKGLNCVGLEEFESRDASYDIVLMSHIIEHFEPVKLKNFIDSYLDRLNNDGYLIIATPLLTKYFYEDFDHVKPYSPAGLLMVFGAEAAQVQYRSRHTLVLEDLWFRRSYLRVFFAKGRYLKSGMNRAIQALNLLGIIAYLISFRLIARKDGWMGVFRKIG